MTFNPTKPVLTTEEEKDRIENYINANVIEFEGKKIIATQAPLTSTFYNFYRMVEKYNITSAFMLCCLIEKNRKKCDRYWPNQETEGGKMIEK
jgi:tyrosine-protein phosphatase non-receptor type 12/18/22